ncbi:MAG: hypothetical protein DI544_02950 [Sphingomonas taxi]|uniref:Uncharacterized protein n=1 Tax=Sphingomonas taxi TaxID=1549858 RepID=A0A2W5P722_9SPHN|nr:MAG: hypothetical protein DI544_02950 [Sphingomonas taxi]
MKLKQLGLAALLGAIAAFVSFFPMRAVLTAWYMHEAPRDGQSGLGVIAGSVYFALFCAAITFGISLNRSRRRS